MSVTPPRPKGPPMTSLRAFEAAARLGGITRAAEELNVTAGAVAQQVKSLEDWLGVELFERRAQGVVLNQIGQQALPPLTAAFDVMGEAVDALRQAARPERIHIAALPAVAQLWLSPRLPEIRKALPDLEISVTALETPPNLVREPFDLSVFFGDGRQIAQNAIFPVCSPEIAKHLRQVSDLADFPCLGDAVWKDDWQTWLDHVQSSVVPRGPVYSLYALAVEEAVNGAGVLMGHSTLVQRHLQDGRLVAPFAGQVVLPNYLALRYRDAALTAPLKALLELLSGESGR